MAAHVTVCSLDDDTPQSHSFILIFMTTFQAEEYHLSAAWSTSSLFIFLVKRYAHATITSLFSYNYHAFCVLS